MPDEITVTWGEEKFFPARYQGFTVGPITLTVKPKDGETEEEAFTRAITMLEAQAKRLFLIQRNAFFEKLAVLK